MKMTRRQHLSQCVGILLPSFMGTGLVLHPEAAFAKTRKLINDPNQPDNFEGVFADVTVTIGPRWTTISIDLVADQSVHASNARAFLMYAGEDDPSLAIPLGPPAAFNRRSRARITKRLEEPVMQGDTIRIIFVVGDDAHYYFDLTLVEK
jgi:hypothetical protein